MKNHKTLTAKINDWNKYIDKEKRKIAKEKVVPLKMFQRSVF